MKVIYICHHQYLLLVVFLVVHLLFVECLEPFHCGGELLNAESGEIVLPSSGNVSCHWIISAPPGKKLLINVESIHLATENESFSLKVDDLIYKYEQECDKCWTNLVGQSLQIVFASHSFTNTTEEELGYGVNDTVSSSFHVSYKSFDPSRCDLPKTLTNGYHVGKNWTVHNKIFYKCHPPYEIDGKDKLNCVVPKDSPVPTWDDEPPRCIIPSCHNKIINQTAGKGIIVHPGYPAKTVLSNQYCQWYIRTEENRRITIAIKSFSLPVPKGKSSKANKYYVNIYDNATDNLLSQLVGQIDSKLLITTSNKLIIVLNIGNMSAKTNEARANYGFFIEYAATCPVLVPPMNGRFDNHFWSIGSNLTVECKPGFHLDSDKLLHCLPNGSWSSNLPSCISDNFSSAAVDVNSPSSDSKVDVKMFAKISPKGSKKTEVNYQSTSAKEKNEKPSKNDLDKSQKEASGDNSQDKLQTPTTTQLDMEEESDSSDTFTVLVIACAISIPLVLIIVGLVVCLWYRKRYPARMVLGRKFETFENPAYQKRKRAPTMADPLENPAELQCLTKLTSP